MSKPPFSHADFALLRDPRALLENTRALGREVGFDEAHLHQTNQVHGARIFLADAPPSLGATRRDADALVATHAGEAVAVRVADCVPILVGDAKTGHVAAIHAGWKGVVANVIGATLTELAPRDPIAAIGPCIGPCCFEVSRDVAEKIATASTPACIVSTHKKDGEEKAMVDLRVAVAHQFHRAKIGLNRIEQVPATSRENPKMGCTRCDAARFYSFRRDADFAGRMLAVIVCRESK